MINNNLQYSYYLQHAYHAIKNIPLLSEIHVTLNKFIRKIKYRKLSKNITDKKLYFLNFFA